MFAATVRKNARWRLAAGGWRLAAGGWRLEAFPHLRALDGSIG